MQLHQLQSSSGNRRPVRVGRGGKRGTTSGRGQKGQKSRSGRRIRPAMRDLISRIPKRRGFRNKIKSPKPLTLQLSVLVTRLKALNQKPAIIDQAFLKQLAFISKRYSGRVKILGRGEAPFALTLKGIEASDSVKKTLEKAGGGVQ